MSTSNQKRREPRSILRDVAVPALACLAIFATGCGGGSGSDIPANPDPGPDGGGPQEPPPQVAAPTIATIDPAAGPPAGGTLVTVLGSGFLESAGGSTSVRFGEKDALDLQVIDDVTLTCVTPQGTPDSTVDVRVENSRGVAVLEGGFSYLSLPSVSTDLDDDGIADMVISAQFDSTYGLYAGTVYVFYGVESPETLLDMSAGDAHVKLMGAAAGDRFGCSVASGDVNGDGKDDLLIGASYVDSTVENSGAVYVFLGPLPDSGALSALQADVILSKEGIVENDWFGASLAVADVNGDLIDDLLAGAPGVELESADPETLENVGAAYLFFGSADISDDVAANADLAYFGDEAEDQLGNACLLADLNHDELADVVIGAYLANPMVPPKKYDAGAVYVFLAGPDLSGGRGADADFAFTGEQPADQFGTSLASGDANGDSISDLMVGAPGSQALGSETGRAYALLGSTQPTGRNASLADAIYSGQQSNADFGRDLTCSDFNGDGFEDLAIGAPHNSFGANKNGRCYVFLGAEVLEDGLAHFADVIYTGEIENGDRFGSAIEVIDLNGDGLADMMSSAIGNCGGGLGAGRVYTFEGEQLPVDETAYQDDLTLTGEADEANFGSSISRGL